MRWIISCNKEIAVDRNQMHMRRIYIQRVTGAEVSEWTLVQENGQSGKKYLYCTSNDGVNGTFITAHIHDVYTLCCLKKICTGEFIVANTCIWERMSHKKLLYKIMSFNRDIQLWFAKQELSVDPDRVFRQSTTINNVGRFGFRTSLSEREFFKNRGKGLVEAIRASFIRVSPVILLGD